MKISEENSIDLINSYLDNEASKKELELISKLIAEDANFAAMFYEYRSIYIATSRHYAKEIKLQKLPKAKRPSVFRGNLEWGFFLLMLLTSIFLIKKGISSASEKYRSLTDKPAFAGEDSFAPTIKDFFVEAYNFYTLVDLKEE